jgi:hypothetical protein
VLVAALSMPLHGASPGRARPLTDPQATTAGWLLVSGPEREGSGCVRTRAYDVATGATFVDDACSGGARSGRIPVAIARSILSALLERVELPWAPEPQPPTSTWLWIAGEDSHLIGDLPWTAVSDQNGERAVSLFNQADAAFARGCRPPLPPQSMVLVATLPRMVNPVSADASQELTVRYRAARERWVSLKACAAPAGR